MGKIFIDVKTPCNGKTYEFELDDTMKVETAKARMVSGIKMLEKHSVSFDESALLSDKTIEKILADNISLTAAGVKSGHTLVLV